MKIEQSENLPTHTLRAGEQGVEPIKGYRGRCCFYPSIGLFSQQINQVISVIHTEIIP